MSYDPNGSRSIIKNQHKYGHNLNRDLHAQEIYEICRRIYINGSPASDVYQLAMEEFLAKHPECWCKSVNHFKKWACRRIGAWNKLDPDEQQIQQVYQLVKEHLKKNTRNSVLSAKRYIDKIINKKRRVMTGEMIERIATEVYNEFYPMTPISEWQDAYESILMDLYWNKTNTIDAYIHLFNRKTKTRFPVWFIMERIKEVNELYKPIPQPLEFLECNDIKDIQSNVVAFKQRGYDKETIKDKILFQLEMDGFDRNSVKPEILEALIAC